VVPVAVTEARLTRNAHLANLEPGAGGTANEENRVFALCQSGQTQLTTDRSGAGLSEQGEALRPKSKCLDPGSQREGNAPVSQHLLVLEIAERYDHQAEITLRGRGESQRNTKTAAIHLRIQEHSQQ